MACRPRHPPEGLGGSRRLLASALGSTAGLLDIQSDPDREVVLEAVVKADRVAVGVSLGKRLPRPDHSSPDREAEKVGAQR
jgi:hypothetical protein